MAYIIRCPLWKSVREVNTIPVNHKAVSLTYDYLQIRYPLRQVRDVLQLRQTAARDIDAGLSGNATAVTLP